MLANVTSEIIGLAVELIRSKRLRSRKFWAGLAGAVLLTLGEQLGLSMETTLAIAGLVTAYIGGQAYVDAKRQESNGKGQ